MTIQDNLNRIQQAKSDIKAAIESKGVYVDEADKIDIYASKIYEIEQGSSCNLGHLYADLEDYDGEGNCWWYADEQGLDGFNYVKINASQYGQDKYNQGFADGQNGGGGIDVDSEGDGTLENPYQVGQARNIGYALEDGGISDYVYVKGYVYSIDYVNEGGTATYDLNNNMDESIKVQDGLWWHGVVPFDGPWDLEVNDIVVLKCQIEKYEPWEDAGWYDVRIAPNSGVEKLERPQVDELILNAEVLDITDNGTIYTKFSENIPEWTEPETGDDFYSYAKVEATAYKTQYTPNFDTKVEFWWRKSGTVNLNIPILGITYFGVFPYFSNFYVSLNGTTTYFDINDDNWHHFQLSMKDGFWMDGVQIATYTGTSTNITNAGPIMINGEEVNILKNSGDFGMIKIDDNIIIPTEYGFKDLNNNELLEMYTGAGNPSYNFVQIEKPEILNNLIKQVNVNIPLPALDTMGIRLGHSTFERVPDGIRMSLEALDYDDLFYNCKNLVDISTLAEWDTSKATRMNNMFSSCSNLADITPLANWDIGNLTYMNNMFNSCSKLADISPLAGWNTGEVANMESVFKNCSSLVDASPLAGWDTSKVKTMAGMFYNCTKLITIPALDCSSVGTSYNSTGWFGSNEMTALTNMGGFINLKISSTGSYCLNKCPNLTYESCINILDGLYDFTGNGETPTSSQGKLKVHQNFLNLVGDEISIGTNKGWTITA